MSSGEGAGDSNVSGDALFVGEEGCHIPSGLLPRRAQLLAVGEHYEVVGRENSSAGYAHYLNVCEGSTPPPPPRGSSGPAPSRRPMRVRDADLSGEVIAFAATVVGADALSTADKTLT